MLKLYNSLTKQLEEFSPINDGKVTLYVCGITPYDTTHLGHAFTYISFDLLVRTLNLLGYKVDYTQNVTDINDRDNDILKKAKEQNVSWEKLGEFWTEKFLKDMKNLNWVMPNNYLMASEQIPAMVEIAERILKSGNGYMVNGSVYLDVEKFKDFGKLSCFDKEKMLSEARNFEEDLENKDKRHPLDITLWRASSPDQPKHIPSFNSPFGKGRPGWHIECSAMAIHSLGEQIDIHGGGIDLIYPHHEAEIAQSESATGRKPFAKFWMHNGTVSINGEKMSKSKGNLILVSDLLKKYSANAIRWVLLSHHYREYWNYNENEFVKADKTLNEIKNNLKAGVGVKSDSNVLECLTDDLNAPKALKFLEKNPSKILFEKLGFIF